MTSADLVDAVRESSKTELSRLGSSKSLYADTEGEMEPGAVLTAAADASHHAAETLEDWAAESDVDAAFAAASEAEGERAADIAAKLDDYDPAQPPAVVAALEELDSAVDRLGGLVGWTLVAEEQATQTSGFFTGQADPQTASLFRGFGDGYEATRETALDALATVCDSEDDWGTAEAAAIDVIEAAYDEYFETLEELGVNPKPVC